LFARLFLVIDAGIIYWMKVRENHYLLLVWHYTLCEAGSAKSNIIENQSLINFDLKDINL